MMDTCIIEHKIDTMHRGWDFPLQLSKQGEKLFLPLVECSLRINLPSSCVKGGKQVERPSTFVLVLQACWQTCPCGERGHLARTWLQIRLLIHAQHHLLLAQGTSVQLN